MNSRRNQKCFFPACPNPADRRRGAEKVCPACYQSKTAEDFQQELNVSSRKAVEAAKAVEEVAAERVPEPAAAPAEEETPEPATTTASTTKKKKKQTQSAKRLPEKELQQQQEPEKLQQPTAKLLHRIPELTGMLPP